MAGEPRRAGPEDLGGRLRRAATPARLLAKGASAAALARARALRGDAAGDIVADPKMVAAAEDIARTLGEMKGAAMKIGQALSFIDVSLIPAEYRSALAVLQSDAPPMPLTAVHAVVEEELGAPVEELFDWFSPNPIAAASIGQVHMAHLGDREVVVKVQYPGVAKAVEADLRNAALLSGIARLGQRMLAGLAGDLDVRALIDEVRDRITDELDYRIEAANQRALAAAFADDPDIGIPAVIDERSSRRVLTTEYVDADRWSAALTAPQALRDRWGEVIARFSYACVYVHGTMNSDSHPGNFLFHDDGRVTFLDWGCVVRFTEDELVGMRRLWDAMLAGDDDGIIDAMVAMGSLKRGDGFDHEVLLQPLRRALTPVRSPQPFRYTKELVEEVIAEGLKLRAGVDELKLLQRLNAPRYYVLYLRSVVGMEAVLSHLEATVDFDRVFAQLWDDYEPPLREAG